MKKCIYTIVVIATFIMMLTSCVYPFEVDKPGEFNEVVSIDGNIIIGGEARFIISQSMELGSQLGVKSLAGTVYIESEDGMMYYGTPFQDTSKLFVDNVRITYRIDTRDADPHKKYRLVANVKTYGYRDEEYRTDFMEVLETPPIDSIYYKISSDRENLTIMVDTHSDAEEKIDFKWRFHEDWENNAHIVANCYYDTLRCFIVEYKDFESENRYYCWRSQNSYDILIANTDKLTENRISGQKLITINKHDRRMSSLYAIEVYQERISEDCYTYWDNVRKNNEKLGGIFSPQPNDLPGNIHSITYPKLRVLGYISACTAQKVRIFIDNSKLFFYDLSPHICQPKSLTLAYWPNAYSSGYDVAGEGERMGEFYWYPKSCVDCRVSGSKIKPDYWPR